MPWARIVPSEDEYLPLLERLHRTFTLGVWLMSGSPSDAGLFTKGKMIYFSPKAAELYSPFASEVKLVECAAPSRDDVEPIAVGDLDSIPFASK